MYIDGLFKITNNSLKYNTQGHLYLPSLKRISPKVCNLHQLIQIFIRNKPLSALDF